MEALKYKTIIKNDGEIKITGAPIKKGQEVEMIVLVEPDSPKDRIMRFAALQLHTSSYTFNRDELHER